MAPPRKYILTPGQAIHEWTVISDGNPATLRCRCGTVVSIRPSQLFRKNDSIKRCLSCGIKARQATFLEKSIATINIKIGDRFGKLTVEKIDGRRSIFCRCECGNLGRYRIQRLESGSRRSCGCGIAEHTTGTNIKRYGVRSTAQVPEIRARQVASLVKKYGCTNPLQNKEIASKVLRTQGKTVDMIHWKTGERLACQGSYEVAVVNFLNRKQENFDWQIVFNLENGKTYRVDLFLPDRNLYVEIKGRWFADALHKFQEFRSKHPNSEVWDCKKLTEMGVFRRTA